MDSRERVTLHVPRGELALSAMRVVVGWVASCYDLPLDSLDDVNLAVETLLAEESDEGELLSLVVSIEEGCVAVEVCGLQNRQLEANLCAREPFEPSLDCPLDVKLFLDALVERYDVARTTESSFSVCMQKRIV